jgi:mannosyl-oligosaccharide alpha-1,2-mannosidase
MRYPAEAASLTLSAEIGSLTLEFTRLSQLTKDSKYFDAVQRISDELERQQDLTALPGLWPITFDATQLNFTKDKTFTLGGMADSLYEYIPKQYLMLGGAMPQYRTMYEKFASAAEKHIFFRPMIPDTSRELLIAGTLRKTAYDGAFAFRLDPEGQHLTCFLGGLYGIGSRIFDRPEDLVVAKKLVDGCVWAYESAPNGIAPEIFRAWPCQDANHCPWNETEYLKGVISHSPSVESASHPRNSGGLAKAYIDRNNLPKGFTAVGDTRYVLRYAFTH